MIQMQYRGRTLNSDKWDVYGESTRITKDFRQFAKELSKNEFCHYEWRYIDTKKNPEQVVA